MYEIIERFGGIHPVELETPRFFTICHDSVVSTDNTGKKAKSDNSFTIGMFQTFIIDQCYFFSDDLFDEFLVVRL